MRFTASEPATFLCVLDGADIPCAGLLSGLSDGAHSIMVIAVDAAGNSDPDPPQVDFSVAVPPPAVDTPEEIAELHPPCPCCGGRMIVIETFARWQQPRAPPVHAMPARMLAP